MNPPNAAFKGIKESSHSCGATQIDPLNGTVRCLKAEDLLHPPHGIAKGRLHGLIGKPVLKGV
jgi:hypothetical protein